MSFAEIDAMTMDDYADMEAYWGVNPPVGRLVAAYFKLKPARVRRRASSDKSAEAAGGVDAAQLAASLGL
jgi:hypothetical protein